MEAGKVAKTEFLRNHDGKTLELLPQKPKNGAWRGYSENHIFLTAANFTPNTTVIKQGIPVSGIYHFYENNESIEEMEEE